MKDPSKIPQEIKKFSYPYQTKKRRPEKSKNTKKPAILYYQFIRVKTPSIPHVTVNDQTVCAQYKKSGHLARSFYVGALIMPQFVIAKI